MSEEPKIPTDEELHKAAKILTDALETQLALTFGELIEIPRQEFMAKFYTYLKKAIPRGISYYQKINGTSDEDEQRKMLFEMLNDFTKLIQTHFHTGNLGLKEYLENEGTYLTDFSPPKYLKHTKIQRYIEQAQIIIDTVLEDSEAAKLAPSFIQAFHTSDDYRSMGQTFYAHHEEYLDYLKTSREEMTQPDIRHYLDIYLNFCGFFEKLLCFLLGLRECLKGKKPDYQTLRLQKIYKNLQIAQRWELTQLFTQAFSRKVRNAVAHKTFELDPKAQKVNFRDLRNRLTETWLFENILDNCRELFAAIIVLFRIGITLQLKVLKKMIENLVQPNA